MRNADDISGAICAINANESDPAASGIIVSAINMARYAHLPMQRIKQANMFGCAIMLMQQATRYLLMNIIFKLGHAAYMTKLRMLKHWRMIANCSPRSESRAGQIPLMKTVSF